VSFLSASDDVAKPRSPVHHATTKHHSSSVYHRRTKSYLHTTTIARWGQISLFWSHIRRAEGMPCLQQTPDPLILRFDTWPWKQFRPECKEVPWWIELQRCLESYFDYDETTGNGNNCFTNATSLCDRVLSLIFQ
jgi:hypothetical protein